MINAAITIGAAFIIIGLYLFASTLNIRLNGVHTKAIVVEIIREKGDDWDDGTSYWPVFEYNVDGQVHRTRRRYGSGWTRCYVGQEVELICHGNEYKKIEVKSDCTMLLVPIICIAIGAMVMKFFR